MAVNIDSKVHVLFKQLQCLNDIPKKFPVQGLVKSIAQKILPYSIFVDKWPDYNVIVTKPRENQKLPVYTLGIYGKDPDSLWKVLSKPNFLCKEVPIRIYGLQIDLLPTIKDVTDHLKMNLNVITEDDPRYITSISEMPRRESGDKGLPDECYFSPLSTKKHVEYITSLWRYRHLHHKTFEEAITVIGYFMDNGPTCGVFSKDDDKLLSWMISNIDRTQMIGHTLPEYRKQNLMFYGIHEMVKQKLKMGDTFLGFVAQSNPTVANSLIKMGFKVHYDTEFVHCILRP